MSRTYLLFFLLLGLIIASGTYGFSASLELDINALEKKFNAYKEQSVASNITASNININADNTATVRGSNLKASDKVNPPGDTLLQSNSPDGEAREGALGYGININAKDTNILASQDVNTSSNSSESKNINLSLGIYGGAAGKSVNFNLDNLSGSASANSSKGSSRGITNQNSQLVASNIHINTNETTSINGANISAKDKLNISTKNLDVASVQDSQNSRSQSSGFSVSGGKNGISGVGVAITVTVY